MSDCVFCKIVSGEIPSNKVYEDDDILCFRDLDPQAPVHVLIIPKKHIASLDDVTEEDKWTARPVWYFSTDDTSFMLTADEAPEGATGRYTSSFAVDAQTGVLESRVTAVDEG